MHIRKTMRYGLATVLREGAEEEESEKREEHYCLAFARSLKSLSLSGDSNSIIKELRPPLLPLKAFLSFAPNAKREQEGATSNVV